MSFDTQRANFLQEHFTVVEIVLPSCTTCTAISGLSTQYYTPLTCEESADDEYTIYLSTENKPIEYGHPLTETAGAVVLDDPVHPVIGSVNETVTELQPGKGLALKGSAKITVRDFDGDPGPINTSTNGTYFGKLRARNIVENKKITIRQFHRTSDGVYLEADSQDREYIIDTMVNNGNGTWTISARDPLTKTDKDRNQFPVITGGSIRTAVDNSTTTIPVDASTDWEQIPRPYIIKCGDELMKVTSVASNLTASAALTVATRGTAISFTNQLTYTTADSHAVGDDIQICHTADQERIDRLLQEILYTGSGLIIGDYVSTEGTITLVVNDLVEVGTGHSAGGTVGNVYKSIDITGSTDLTAQDYSGATHWEDLGARQASIGDWKDEIDQWHSSTDLIDGVYHEPIEAGKALGKVLQDYLLDMWWDPVDKLVKVSAISVWKDTSGDRLEEGTHINEGTLRIKPLADMQFTRAYVWYNKPDKIKSDDVENYRAVSINTNTALEVAGLYGEAKTKAYDPSTTLDTDQADLLVQRTVSRFGYTPNEYSWMTEERFLDFEVGDVREISTTELQDADGNAQIVRAQITSIQPLFGEYGRSYKCKALSYEAAFASGTAFTVTGANSDVNLYTLAGAPSTAVDVTFVFDAATISSTSISTGAVRAGAFPSGSTITIILINSADWQAKGGGGGIGGDATYEPETPEVIMDVGSAGIAGGICYDAEGIDTDIYLGGTIDVYTATGTLKAPGGGGGGGGGGWDGSTKAYGGGGGGGGAGNTAGVYGAGGFKYNSPGGADGTAGASGDTSGNGGLGGISGDATTLYGGDGGDWGTAGTTGDQGANAGAAGGAAGAAGKGIIKGGAVVNVYTDGNSSRFINGGGDTPDATS